MKAALVTIVLFAGLCLAACQSSERPPLRKGEPLALRVNVPPDTVHWVDASFRDLGRYGFMGEEIRIEGFTRFVYELRATQRSRTGDTHFSVTPQIYEVKDQVVTPRGDRIRPPEMDALFSDMQEAIRLHPFTFTVGANGNITHIGGLDALENSVAGVISRADIAFDGMAPVFQHAWRRAFMAHIDERPIRRHLQETYGFLPGGPVRLGDTWVSSGADAPWPFLPVSETTRLINWKGDQLYIESSGDFSPPPESDWATYKGSKRRQIYVEPATGLGVEQQEQVYWKRKRQRTPWEQFTLKSLEASSTVRIEQGPMRDSPHLYAIHRFPFMESPAP